MSYGIIVPPYGIGDQLQFSSIPENFYWHHKDYLIDVSRSWVFDYNPYVLRDKQEDKSMDLWRLSEKVGRREKQFDMRFSTLSERNCFMLSIPCRITRPRLYRFEDEPQTKGLVTVHTTGKSEGRTMPDHVIQRIARNYQGYRIIQVGGKDDKKTPFEQALGTGIWEMAEIIAKSEIFIGVNSGPMNIAKCYPKVRKKIVVLQYMPEELERFYPMRPGFTQWLDCGLELYNETEWDIGATWTHKII